MRQGAVGRALNRWVRGVTVYVVQCEQADAGGAPHSQYNPQVIEFHQNPVWH